MKRIAAIIALVLLAGVALWHPPGRPPIAIGTSAPLAPSSRSRDGRRHEPSLSSQAVVYVVGAVARPGLYRVRGDARIDDAVRLAGGLRRDADPAGVNLAAHVSDGDEIAVPIRGQPHVAVRAKRSRDGRTSKAATIVDLNRATAAELAKVPGIGPTLAARIIDVRTSDGDFTSADQLLDVAGMTQARLDRAQDFLRIAF